MQQLLEDEATYSKLKAHAVAKHGDAWLDHLQDAKREVAEQEPVPEPECYVLMKDGFQLRLDLSTSQAKFLKKTGGHISAVGPDGKKCVIDASRIKRISSNFIA